MSDLISRQDVLDYIDAMPSELTSDGRRMIRRIRLTEYIADTLPSAERKGKWAAELIAKLKHLEQFNSDVPAWVYKVIEGAK